MQALSGLGEGGSLNEERVLGWASEGNIPPLSSPAAHPSATSSTAALASMMLFWLTTDQRLREWPVRAGTQWRYAQSDALRIM